MGSDSWIWVIRSRVVVLSGIWALGFWVAGLLDDIGGLVGSRLGLGLGSKLGLGLVVGLGLGLGPRFRLGLGSGFGFGLRLGLGSGL